jgi:hypothetical protein
MMDWKNAKATLLLAQYAQVADGMLNVIGGGWTVIGAQPAPYFIAGLIELPWGAVGVQHTLKLELIDGDGNPVCLKQPDGTTKELVIDGQFDVAPSPGTKRGTPLVLPLAIPVPPCELAPGERYEWRLEVDGEAHVDWRIGFATRPEAQSNVA